MNNNFNLNISVKTKFILFKQELVCILVRFFDIILFLTVIVKLILDLVGLCQAMVDAMSVFNTIPSDILLQMSNCDSSAGSNIPPTKNTPESGGSPGGNPNPGAPEGFGDYSTNRRMIHDDGT